MTFLLERMLRLHWDEKNMVFDFDARGNGVVAVVGGGCDLVCDVFEELRPSSIVMAISLTLPDTIVAPFDLLYSLPKSNDPSIALLSQKTPDTSMQCCEIL
jgi:hypothetical protein